MLQATGKEMVVHGISEGKPLCGFSDKSPEKWSQSNLHSAEIRAITCAECKKALETLAGAPNASTKAGVKLFQLLK